MAEHIPITRLTVSGFKSLAAEIHLEVCPLTILAGANSSGKSSMVQPLLMLKQTLEAPYDPGALLLNGAHVQYDHAGQFLRPTGGDLLIGVKFASTDLQFLNSYHYDGQSLTITATTYGDKALVITPDMPQPEIRVNLLPEFAQNELGDLKVVRDRFHLAFSLAEEAISENQKRLSSVYFAPEAIGIIANLNEFLTQIIHVPAFRENPRRYSYTPATGPQFAGLFTHYHASLIQQWRATNDPRLAELTQALGRLGLAQQIDAELNFGTQLELKIQPPKSSQLNSLADVGFGVSQVLPVLVALLVAQPGQFVYIEQPEVHLHPRAQVALAAEFAAAAKRGVQVVVETHSDLFLLGVQTQIAEGQLPKDLVRLNWFSLESDGTTRINTVMPDDDGSYGGWGEDFGEVALHAQNRYLTAAEAHLFK